MSGLGPLETRFVTLIDDGYSGVAAAAFAVLVALAVGAFHALGPGHGKTIAASYLVASDARPRDAVLIGVVVATMHTASVLALGLALHLTVATPRLMGGGTRLTGAMTLSAGVLVCGVGLRLVVLHLRRWSQGGHAHTHVTALPSGVSPLGRRGLVAIGLSGGLLPSPSAFLVITTALFLGKLALGLLLVAAFSVGLAATLSLCGLLVLRGRSMVERRSTTMPRGRRLLRVFPVVSAVLVVLGGSYLVVLGLRAW